MVRFQADADLNQIIVAALVRRAPGVDFRTAEVAQLKGLNDRDVLALAARDGPVSMPPGRSRSSSVSGRSTPVRQG